MNQIQLDEFNKEIGYKEGEIFWKPNYNYTSELWESLKKQGWHMSRIKNFVEIYDNTGFRVVDTIGLTHALKELAIKLR